MPHFEPLSPLDASFLYVESRRTHMHVGAVAVLDGPRLDGPAFERHVESRLSRVPHCRQRLAWVPAGQGRPVWVDDAAFDVRHHARFEAPASPADERSMLQWASEHLGRPLDRARPLWEMRALPLEGGRMALLTKLHHCMVDGLGAVEVGAAMMDLDPRPPDTTPSRWQPRPAPGPAELLWHALRERARQPLDVWVAAQRMARDPGAALGVGRDALGGVLAYARAALELAPRTSFNGPIGPHRRFEVVRADLGAIKRIKDRFGCKVNDVVMALVAGGLRRLMLQRGERVQGVTLRAMVPVNLRPGGTGGARGNQVSWLVADLPVGLEHPLDRLRFVHRNMADLKQSKQSLGVQLAFGLSDYAPPSLVAAGCRLYSHHQRTFNLVVTNVPGPQLPLFLGGCEMLEAFPVVPIAGSTSLGVAVLSYNGKVCFGLQADAGRFPDLRELAVGIEAALDELALLAGTTMPKGRSAPASAGSRRRPRRSVPSAAPAPAAPRR
jgi:diacylglycerol O-acyltransferase / wax synthase